MSNNKNCGIITIHNCFCLEEQTLKNKIKSIFFENPCKKYNCDCNYNNFNLKIIKTPNIITEVGQYINYTYTIENMGAININKNIIFCHTEDNKKSRFISFENVFINREVNFDVSHRVTEEDFKFANINEKIVAYININKCNYIISNRVEMSTKLEYNLE